jgi:hypothetical protein
MTRDHRWGCILHRHQKKTTTGMRIALPPNKEEMIYCYPAPLRVKSPNGEAVPNVRG